MNALLRTERFTKVFRHVDALRELTSRCPRARSTLSWAPSLRLRGSVVTTFLNGNGHFRNRGLPATRLGSRPSRENGEQRGFPPAPSLGVRWLCFSVTGRLTAAGELGSFPYFHRTTGSAWQALPKYGRTRQCTATHIFNSFHRLQLA